MILSEIFQNAIKATVNQGYVDRLIMHIGLDTTAGFVTFILINKGKMYGNIQILEAMGDGFPEKHQGGWICRHLATDLKGTITWAEENDSVKVTLKVPFYVGDEINP